MSEGSILYSSFKLGDLNLKNRIAMAPMTRSRAIDFLPNDLMKTYYTERASAGLIISEGIAPSIDGHGYPRVPGIYSDRQIVGWKKITDSVRGAGGHIYAQLWHVGRIAHPLNQPPGGRIIAPSEILVDKILHTDQEGKQAIPMPEKMSIKDIERTKNDFVQAAVNSIEAGFHGIEVHAANGYIFQQFLNPHSNKRTDSYGGTIENRSRFFIETVEAISAAIGPEKVGVRWSPYSNFSGFKLYDEIHETYIRLTTILNSWSLAYIHLNTMDRDAAERLVYTRLHMRDIYDGNLILCGNYNKDKAERALYKDEAEMIAFGRPYIANPDLVDRFKNDTPLAESDPTTYYTHGPEGYINL